MSCEGLKTGQTFTSWLGFGPEYVCFDYTDPETMRETKLALAEVAGVATRHDATVWTWADEGALALANAELADVELGKRNEVGWYVPGPATAQYLLAALGYPENERLLVEYPVLSMALDKYRKLDEAGPALLASTDPRVGAAGAPAPIPGAPPLPEPEVPPPEEPWEPEEPYEPPYEREEAAVVPISPMMLAGAALAVVGVGAAVVYAVRS